MYAANVVPITMFSYMAFKIAISKCDNISKIRKVDVIDREPNEVAGGRRSMSYMPLYNPRRLYMGIYGF